MAQYVMEEMNLPQADGKKRLYPRLINKRSITHESLVSYVATHCGFDRGTVKGVLSSVADCVGELMGFNGASVHIDGLGTFSPTLGIKRSKQQEANNGQQTHIDARDLCVDGIAFRADKALIKHTDEYCTIEHSPYESTIRPNSTPYTAEQRRQRLIDYLSEHAFIRGKQYEELTCMAHTSAGKELRKLSEGPDALLDIQGRGSHRVYTLRTTPS